VIAAGTGYKLVCKGGSTEDPACHALCATRDNRFVDQGLTVLDTCTGLEWEKKDGADGVPGNGTADAGNLHDVDNLYAWAGDCSDSNELCQPNAAAAAVCAAQTGGALGCGQCPSGDFHCQVTVPRITTIWNWVSQMNAAAFAGHTDWRIATSAGNDEFPTGESPELASILDLTQGLCSGGAGACILPVFGPTAGGLHWTSSQYTNPMFPNDAGKWLVSFDMVDIFDDLTVSGPEIAARVRAVRDAP
jgi:hypothetical protein